MLLPDTVAKRVLYLPANLLAAASPSVFDIRTESARRPDPAAGYVVLSADRDGFGNDSTNA
jgi:hypothetical protein